MYGTACSTCHTAAPKLNVLGEAFRLNGYEMPETRLLERSDDPVSLGAEPWKDAWPRAIWPGTLPGMLPAALRIQADMAVRGGGREPTFSYDFPHEIYLLAGGPLGGGAWAFLEMEWSEESGFEVEQAKVGFQNVIPGLPDRALNLSLGYLNPFLLNFTDRQTDRAGRQKLSWQDFSLEDVRLSAADGAELTSPDATVMGSGIAAVELNGLVGGRVHWGAGLAQGGSDGTRDRNDRKDPYYRVRVKLGGLDYRARYPARGGPVPNTGGQLLDRSFTFEHFGYFGDESTPEAPVGSHRALGWAVRRLQGRADVGVGHVRRHYDAPYGAGGGLDARSWFAKGEYLIWPWLIASAKYDRLTVEASPDALPAGYAMAAADQETFIPGLVALVRQNVRLVAEAPLVLGGDRAADLPAGRPHALLVRLDLSF